jgi:hypothetical protein
VIFTPRDRVDWVRQVRRAEQLGYDVVTVSDHLGMPAPIPTMLLAAEATERIRIGTLVFNTAFYQPTVLARDIATLDHFSGGRIEVGLGAGYDRAQFDAAGIPWIGARERVAHLERTLIELKTIFANPDLSPPVAQPGGPPLADQSCQAGFAFDRTGPRTVMNQPGILLNYDGQEHLRYRRMLAGAFTVRRMRSLTEPIRRIVEDHLDDLATAGPGADLVKVFANPVPLLAICELLGVPDADRAEIQRRSSIGTDVGNSLDDQLANFAAMAAYMGELIASARRDPGDASVTTALRRADRVERISAAGQRGTRCLAFSPPHGTGFR